MAKVILFLLLVGNLYAQYPTWIKDGLKIVASFGAQDFKEGYGIVINEGLILTSSSLVYEKDRAKEIVLYNSESLEEPITCLSHAQILALDDTLGLAILKAYNFTDFYCNVLPKPNFRLLHFKSKFFDILKKPVEISNVEGLMISYFLEQEWLNFGIEKISWQDLQTILQENKRNLLGMPLFAGNDFLGILVQKREKQHLSLLKHQEILEFLCKINQNTAILESMPTYKKTCDLIKISRDISKNKVK
ncbi:hypothetical protein [Helicobacter pullorum]|uniref:hypothetical protein n=1 Tax=Helicobacter pullorum TaxID=35818 RepID=UPI001B31B09A|nr:hypothetical protein [Helicobacter pullorum]